MLIFTPDNSHIYLFTKPACVQCNATKRHLKKALDSRYDDLVKVIDVSEDDTARQYLVDKNYLQAPVVHYDGKMWSGFRPDDLDAAIQQVTANATR